MFIYLISSPYPHTFSTSLISLMVSVDVKHIVYLLTPTRKDEKTSVNSRRAMVRSKLQALVYDILPSTPVVFSYVIGS